MSGFAGYLLKVNGTVLPTKFIKLSTYDATPNQRIEESADRSAGGVLISSTCEHTTSKIELNTPYLKGDDVAQLVSILGINSKSNLKREATVEFFCPDTQTYQTGTFYVPDTHFSIYSVSGNELTYMPIRIALIEN